MQDCSKGLGWSQGLLKLLGYVLLPKRGKDGAFALHGSLLGLVSSFCKLAVLAIVSSVLPMRCGKPWTLRLRSHTDTTK